MNEDGRDEATFEDINNLKLVINYPLMKCHWVLTCGYYSVLQVINPKKSLKLKSKYYTHAHYITFLTSLYREMHEQAMEKMLTKLDMTQGDYTVCDNPFLPLYNHSS